MREKRRKRAWELKAHGGKQEDIATTLVVIARSGQSMAPAEGEKEELEHFKRVPLGEQKSKIPSLLKCGAEVYGFRGIV